ncbi:MAG TPA: hypothetical protein VEC99_14915 [Clostridia bacterium]|nr:hypothetical protein [Clostridia bacterium]
MKNRRHLVALILGAVFFGSSCLAQTLVTPAMGGGQVTADMVHIDIYFDAEANQIRAHVDDSYGTPQLRPLEPGFAFDTQQPYAVLNGKAYNSQYGWNVGGFFTLPTGAAIWIELVDSSPQLETYSGWGRLGTYTPIFGTAGSSRLWKWSGVMVHNTYAVSRPATARLYADYHIFIGDATTGSRANFGNVGDTLVRLEWTAVPVEDPLTFKFGAMDQTNGAPLLFINADRFTTNSLAIINLESTNSGPYVGQFVGSMPMQVVPATPPNGGPATNHPALGSCLQWRLVSLSGPAQATLSFWEADQIEPRFRVSVGENLPAVTLDLSQNKGEADADPYGFFQTRRLSVTQPGLYCLGFQVQDSSTNGLGGGPIHSASPVYCVYLQAGRILHALSRQESTVTALFGGEPGRTFFLERTSTLGPAAVWDTVAGPLAGTNRLQTLTSSAGTGSAGFFRLRAE